jgi:hypothetical protein
MVVLLDIIEDVLVFTTQPSGIHSDPPAAAFKAA